MKAISIGLETEVYLTKKEIEIMRHNPVAGILKFRSVGIDDEKTNEIPARIVVDETQRDHADAQISPNNTYLGNADHISFTVSIEYYEQLREHGKAEGARFLRPMGRLDLYADSHLSEPKTRRIYNI